MDQEISIHHSPRDGTRQRRSPRLAVALAVCALLLIAGLGVGSAIFSLLRTPGPDSIQLVAATPTTSRGGRFNLRFRLYRADGQAVGTSLSTTADLLDLKTGKQLLGRQCGFRFNRSSVPGSVEIALTDLHPRGQTRPGRALAQIRMKVMSPKEVLDFTLWNLSGQKLPTPKESSTRWHTFTQEVVLPPPPTSATGPE